MYWAMSSCIIISTIPPNGLVLSSYWSKADQAGNGALVVTLTGAGLRIVVAGCPIY